MEPMAYYNVYGDTIEFTTGIMEPGVISSCVFINGDMSIYKQIKEEGRVTKVIITGIIRLILNNRDLESFIIDGKIKLNTLLSYIPVNNDPVLIPLIKEINQVARKAKTEVDLSQLLTNMAEEPR